jgi:hypothetical protein
MRITTRPLLCGSLLAASALASIPTNADMPIAVAPHVKSPCDSRRWKRMSLKELAQQATKTAEAGRPNEWDPCALTQLRERGAASVPVFIDLMNNPLTRGEAMYSLMGMGGEAAPAIPAIMHVIDEDQKDATNGIRILSLIGVTVPGSVVPALIKYSSSTHEDTAISAIVALHNMGAEASSAIEVLAEIALSDTTPPTLAVKNAAAAAAVGLGEYEPSKVGSYLVRFSQRVELAPGVCQGVRSMGAAAKPWASDLRAGFSAALVVAQKREDEIHNSEPSVDLYRELMRTREGAWCIQQALAILSDNTDSPK